jgi:CubicO group peptidase (beta-lactamase class C family)
VTTTPEALTDSQALQERLDATFGRGARKQIFVGFVFRDRFAFAAVGEPLETPANEDAPVLTGCATKLLTASLVQRAAANGGIPLCDELNSVLPHVRVSPEVCFEGITIKNLIEHTHGLDDSRLRTLPRDASGLIDIGALLAQLRSAPRVSLAGRAYSYSNAGAWICAGLLERLYDKSFIAMLSQEFSPQGEPERAERTHGLSACPASGQELTISAASMLLFLQRQFPGNGGSFEQSEESVLREIVDMPGWNALECGVRLGWKYAGSGWFGHSSVLARARGLVRVHPAQRAGIFVLSRDQAPAMVAARVFGAVFPALSSLRVPKPLSPNELREFRPEPYVGAYHNAAQTIRIVDRGEKLSLHVANKDGSSPEAQVSNLVAARNHMFLLQPPIGHLSFVQCLHADESDVPRLWNGQRLWNKAGSSVAS